MIKYFLLLLPAFISFSIKGQQPKIFSTYGIITTIAGKGEIKKSETNGWDTNFEGKPAINAELSRPHFAMSDAEGNIYIADKSGNAIRKISANGIITTVCGTGIPGDNGDGPAINRQLNGPNGLWVLKNGNVYILDFLNSKIRKLTRDGMLTTVIYDKNGIVEGRGLWVNEDETEIFYTSGDKLMYYNITDNKLSIYADGFNELGSVIADFNHNMVVTDMGNNVVIRIHKQGKKEIIAGNGSKNGGGNGYLATETGLNGVRGVWFLEDNSYFLITFQGSQLWYVDFENRIHLFIDGKNDDSHTGDNQIFSAPGKKISKPRSITCDNEGNLIITENDYGFIRMVKKNKN